MNCSTAGLVALVAGAIAIIVGALVASSYGVVGWVVAGGLAAAAMGMMAAIQAAFNAYKTCCDRSKGPSSCSTSNIDNYCAAILAVLGISVSSFLGAAAVFWNFFIGGPAQAAALSTAAVVACVIAIGLLIALLFALISYQSCRNAQSPLGSGSGSGPGSGSGGTGTTPL